MFSPSFFPSTWLILKRSELLKNENFSFRYGTTIQQVQFLTFWNYVKRLIWESFLFELSTQLLSLHFNTREEMQQRHITIIGMTNGRPAELKKSRAHHQCRVTFWPLIWMSFFLTRQQTIHGKGFRKMTHCSGVMTTSIYYEHFFGSKKIERQEVYQSIIPRYKESRFPRSLKNHCSDLCWLLLTLVSLPSFYHHSLKKFSKK